jgi:phosphate:Na+ symporter
MSWGVEKELMALDIVFGLIGGLAFFLFGMKLMSEGLRKVAGEGLKKIIHLFTKTPFIGVLVGAGVTCLIQSSSATSVMVIGLVNATLLTLRQAISVILGANIGTTMTAWLVSSMAVFKITHYALPTVGVGFALNSLGKSSKTKEWGEVILGFGILFVGLSIMKDSFLPLGQHQIVKDTLVKFSAYPILGVLVGMLVTMVLQSSSATIAIVQVLAFNGLISFEAAIPVILGENIGTTITAELAAIGTNLSARRAARCHALFNIIGVAYMMVPVYLGIYSKAVGWFFPGPVTTTNVMAHIAVSHTIFNVFNTFVVFLPLIGWLEKISIKMIPGEVELSESVPQYLEKRLLDTPPVALEQATKEIVRMAKLSREAINNAVEGFFNNDRKLLAKACKREKVTDDLQKEIAQYLIELSQRNLNPDEAEELPVLLHSVNDIERIGDHAVNIVELAERRVEQKLPFSSIAFLELNEMYQQVDKMMNEVINALEHDDLDEAREAMDRENEINKFQTDLRQSHVQRLNDGNCKLLSGLIFIDFVDNLEKVGDHLTNIAQSVLRGLRWAGTNIERIRDVQSEEKEKSEI